MTTLWHKHQVNYFYGLSETFRICEDGRWQCSRLPIGHTDENWTTLATLDQSALAEVRRLLSERFFALPPFVPAGLIPDDFGWICRAELEGRSHEVQIFSNSPPEHRALMADLERLLQRYTHKPE